jgi:hypothetical protein
VGKVLLEQRTFDTTLKGKIRFSEVFEVSSAKGAERTTPEAIGAKTGADAIRGAAEGC